MRIIVDPAKCDGFGYCAEMLPELIALDEWGFPMAGEGHVPEKLLGVARQAVGFCPRRALLVRGPEPPAKAK